MVAFFIPPTAFQRNGPAKTWLGSASNTLNDTTISFGNFTAPTGGLLVALMTCHGDQSRTVSSVSIGGSAATIHETHDTSSTRKAAVVSRIVAAGSHDVSITLSNWNGNSGRNFCGCWLLTDYLSSTPTYALYSYAGSTTSISQTHDIPKYAVALYQVSETDSLPTWTSAIIDGFEDTGAERSYWASRRVAITETGHTETATYAGSGTHLLFTGTVWA